MFTIRSSGLAFFARCVAVTVALFAAASAHAIPITYSFKGLASGFFTVQGDPSPVDFLRKEITVTIATDTDNIDETRFGPGRPATNVLVPGTFSMADLGLGDGTFNSPLYVFNNQDNELAGFGNVLSNDLITVANASAGLDAYDMKSDFGPILGTPPNFVDQFQNVRVNFGPVISFFTLDNLTDATFEATTGVAAPIPEPETWALMALGLGLMAAYGSRRQKSAS